MIALAAALLLPLGAAFAQSSLPPGVQSPLDDVKGVIGELVKAVQALPGDDQASARRARLREVITPHFDFDEMSKRSLGAAWTTCTAAEQEEFVRLFSDLLANTYLNRIEHIQSDTVAFGAQKVEYPKALVKTTVTYKGDKFPIDYKLMHPSGTWRVYDVIIENIGLVANYRNEFAGIIRKDKMSGLLQKLREKTAKK